MSKSFKSRKGDEKIIADQFPEKLAELKQLFLNIGSKRDKPLTAITVANYATKLNRLSVLINGRGFDGTLEWLYKPDLVLQKLRASSLGSKKDFLSPVVKILKYSDAPQEIIEAYQKGMMEFKDVETKDRQKNIATPKEVDESMPLPDILRRIDDYRPQDKMDLVYKLICALYFQNEYYTPRLQDLPLMKFVSQNKKPKDMNEAFNYITLDRNMVPIYIIMNNYKTRAKYGRVKLDISPKVKETLKQYIKAFDKKPGDFVFVMGSKDQPFLKSNFSDLIGQSTEKVLGKRMNPNLMRKIIISDYYNGKHSIEEDQKMASRFLHSVGVGKEYMKLNLASPDDEE